MQRTDIGIEAAPHVLQVEDDVVHVRHLLGRGLLVLAVEADNGQARLGVGAVVDMRPRRRGAAEAVLGAEYLGHVDAAGQQGVHQVGGSHDGGLVAHHGHAAAVGVAQVLHHVGGALGEMVDYLHQPLGARAQLVRPRLPGQRCGPSLLCMASRQRQYGHQYNQKMFHLNPL